MQTASLITTLSPELRPRLMVILIYCKTLLAVEVRLKHVQNAAKGAFGGGVGASGGRRLK